MRTYNSKYLIGDVHGAWSCIAVHIDNQNKLSNKNIAYIHVGDFNIGFNKIEIESRKLSALDDMLSQVDGHLYIIRGNHDNPDWFKEIPSDINIDLARKSFKNIFFIPDYTVLNIDDENILFIGGAISIDRIYRRIKGMHWWPDEVVHFDFEKISSYRNIDRVVCHTAPDFVEPRKFGQIVYSFASNDDRLLDDLRVEREKMTEMVQTIMSNNKIKGYYYGHFHANYKFFHNGCEFIGIGVEEIIPM